MLGILVGALVVQVVIATVLFTCIYRRVAPDQALVRFGFGGTKIIVGDGVLVIPLLHSFRMVDLTGKQIDVAFEDLEFSNESVDVQFSIWMGIDVDSQAIIGALRDHGDRCGSQETLQRLLQEDLRDAIVHLAKQLSWAGASADWDRFAERLSDQLGDRIQYFRIVRLVCERD